MSGVTKPDPIAEFCARCGNHFRGEQICDACQKASAPADPELAAIAAIVAALNELDDGESAGQPHGIYWQQRQQRVVLDATSRRDPRADA